VHGGAEQSKLNKAHHCISFSAEQYGGLQSKTQYRAGQSSVLCIVQQNKLKKVQHSSTEQSKPIQDWAVQHSTLQHSTAQYSTVQYSTVQYSTVQYSIVQYSTVQYSTVQSTVFKCIF
jgi:hypothetical protein